MTSPPAGGLCKLVQERVRFGHHVLIRRTQLTSELVEEVAQGDTIELVTEGSADERAEPSWPGSVADLGEKVGVDGCRELISRHVQIIQLSDQPHASTPYAES